MPQTIRCQYADYVLPQKAGLLDRLLLPVAETLGTAGYRETRQLTVTNEASVPAFEKGLELTIDAATLKRTGAAKFRVVKVTYQVKDGLLQTEAELRELKPTPSQRWYASLKDDTRLFVTYGTLVAVIALIFFGIVVYLNYPEPMWFWAWVGQNVRGLVGWSLFFLFLIALIWSSTKLEGSTWSQDMSGGLFGLLMMGAPFGWLMLSVPPQPLDGSQQGYINYLNYLLSQWQTAAPLLAGLVPWATMILKWLGWDMLSQAIGLMGKKNG
jgi:hypothetical protein